MHACKLSISRRLPITPRPPAKGRDSIEQRLHASYTTLQSIRPTGTSIYSHRHTCIAPKYPNRPAGYPSAWYCFVSYLARTLQTRSARCQTTVQMPQRQSFSSQFLHQVDVPGNVMDANLANARENYKHNFDRTVQCTPPKFYHGQHLFVDRPPMQMTESAPMANRLLPALLPNTVSPCKVISAT